MELSQKTKISATLCGLGSFLFIMGVIFFMERNLMAIGDLMILAAIFNYIGIETVVPSLVKPENYKQSIGLILGTVLILLSWTFVGLIVQIYGIFSLLKSNLTNSIFAFIPMTSMIPSFGSIKSKLGFARPGDQNNAAIPPQQYDHHNNPAAKPSIPF
ncbi:MAG: hypothetical protein MHMPM18_001355 [Marteilia pararefringens]